MKEYDIQTENCYNTDEKGFLQGYVNKAKHVVPVKMLKQGKIKGALQTGNRTWITLVATICGDGTFLPPALIYQGQGNLQTSWLQDFEPGKHNCYFSSTSSGFTNEELAFDWLVSVFDKNTRKKAGNGRHWRLLWLDGHNSHLNLKFLHWAIENRILVAVFPPHSTHRLQPLDVSLFCPLSTRYSQQLKRWIDTTGGVFSTSQKDFFGLFWPAFVEAFNEHNIMSGWSKTGLVPFCPEVVLNQLGISDRPTSSSSKASSSGISEGDWRRIRQLVRDETVDVVNQKLLGKYEAVTTENAILKHKLALAEENIKIQGKRKARSKPLIEEIRAEGEEKAMWISPKKIQRILERNEEKEQKERDKQAEKQQRVDQRAINKAQKAQQFLERKVERERKRVEKAQQQADQKAARETKKYQKEATTQLLLESKTPKKRPQKKKKQIKEAETSNSTDEADIKQKVGESSKTRSGRVLKPTRRFEGGQF